MKFEYDPNKSTTNMEKHGIDFEEAQSLWKDSELVEIPAEAEDEQRFLSIGMIEDIFWTAVTTIRNGNIRIISVRRSRKNEERLYEKNIGRRV
jgi:hypothetical protein